MQLIHLTACAWILAGLVSPLLGLPDGIAKPTPGETIATFIANDIVDTNEEAESFIDTSIDSNKSAERNDTTELNGRDNRLVARKPLLYKPPSKDFSATYNNSGLGYNLTLPGCTPANTVVGDWLSPSGDLIENCTLAQMYQKLSLPQAELSNFMLTSIETLLAKLNNILQSDVCNPPPALPDRELLADPARFRFDPNTHSGYWLGNIVTTVGFSTLAFTGLAAGIIPRDMGLITALEEVAILAAFGTLGTMFTVMAIEARDRRRFGRTEALVLNAAIVAGENMFDASRRVSSCVSLEALQNGIQSLTEAVNERTQTLMIGQRGQTAGMGTAGSSSINLVSQGDIESQTGQCRP